VLPQNKPTIKLTMENRKMLSFVKTAAQGELTFQKIEKLPKAVGVVEDPVNGRLIVGHSETGHVHWIPSDCATLTRVDPFTAFLQVRKETMIVHNRDYDTHAPIGLQPGSYIVRTGREFDPFADLIRASAD
jgi:hypothetical protein